ncbi:nucleotide-binding, alpha-beta plait [Purpureocillium lavendulum]|uniref:Nucleotide-binding, alpha-beta plait n=1 Tax=Purpureocillium lavendulum TaxID=1247861 RepID=A0AB34G0Z3_9HYPO|nr:nucleotide-binding, alpha-beta plait [Purpureocillium lavendulum]
MIDPPRQIKPQANDTMETFHVSQQHWQPDAQLGSSFNVKNDPFVDEVPSASSTLRKNSPTASSTENTTLVAPKSDTPRVPDPVRHSPGLAYHSDITSISWPKIPYTVESSPPSGSSDMQISAHGSRRVLLCNLPHDTSATQVIRSIQCYGGIVSVSTVSNVSLSLIHGGHEAENSSAALIEFVYSASALRYEAAVNSSGNNVAFLTSTGTPYVARAWLAPSHSYPISPADCRLLGKGVTRALRIAPISEDSVRLALSCLTRSVTEVRYDAQEASLTVELVSLFEAERARYILNARRRHIAGDPNASLTISYVLDSSHSEPGTDGLRASSIPHVQSDHISRAWASAPQNPRRPASNSPPSATALASWLGLEPDELEPFLDERRYWKQDVTYRIVGSTATLIRRAWSWRITEEDHTKIFMASTLHDPEWEEHWDRHFEARDEINLRTWERYGAMARHRRERAAQEGVEQWRVTACCGGGISPCEWGCGTMKTAKVVVDYLEAARRPRTVAWEEDDDDE